MSCADPTMLRSIHTVSFFLNSMRTGNNPIVYTRPIGIIREIIVNCLAARHLLIDISRRNKATGATRYRMMMMGWPRATVGSSNHPNHHVSSSCFSGVGRAIMHTYQYVVPGAYEILVARCQYVPRTNTYWYEILLLNALLIHTSTPVRTWYNSRLLLGTFHALVTRC